jgi:pimeloyl-ACP methyl ester carboxylesterase
VPVILDSEWKWKVGGFGGIRRGYPLRHVPVIFVHGNNVDAADWYPVRDDFLRAGWTRQELWGISYGGLGGAIGTALFTSNPERDSEHQEMGDDHSTYITEDDVNVPDLYRFIRMVQAYTGSRRFVLITHSLGVTLARKTLLVHRELRRDLVAFVGIAGPNHGTTFCPPGSEGQVVSCDEIAAGTAWLARLNAGGETFPGPRWMTVYDGTGAGDPAYVGPTYAQSPRLAGAVNLEFPHTYHNDLRMDPAIVARYRTWVEKYATLR